MNTPTSEPVAESAAQKRISELRNIYSDRQISKTSKTMLYGNWGTYKTTIACTMPRPILMHSFDPGGDKLKHVQDGVADGSIIVDSRWQSRVMNQSDDVFQAWNSEYNDLKQKKVFNDIGTFVIDSFTTFQRLVIDAAIASNTKNRQISKKMPIKIPQMRDYGVQDSAMEFVLSDVLDLPCHVLIIAHAEEDKDDDSGLMFHQPLITGKKLRKKIPLLFDEIYVTYVRGKKGQVRTKPQGIYEARTRLGSMFPIEDVYDNSEPGEFNFTRDILVPAGYATPDQVPKL